MQAIIVCKPRGRKIKQFQFPAPAQLCATIARQGGLDYTKEYSTPEPVVLISEPEPVEVVEVVPVVTPAERLELIKQAAERMQAERQRVAALYAQLEQEFGDICEPVEPVRRRVNRYDSDYYLIPN